MFGDPGEPLGNNAEPRVFNRYILWLAKRAKPVFVPIVSIHPQRPDAARTLTRWADQGVREIVWWPLAQHIDLSGAAAKAIYDVNPLLFSLVVMRHVHLPDTDLALPAAVFFGAKSG